MNYNTFFTSLAALSLLGLAGCASISATQKQAEVPACSKVKSAENDASCTGGSDLGPPVVDITSPAPSPGVAQPTSTK